jgi:photosystem II stability/assembly factor-like uncharacterized protein
MSTYTSRSFPAARPAATALAVACCFAIGSGMAGRAARAQSGADANAIVDPALFQELKYRMVGPHRGGRVTAVAGHRREPSTFYMGATGGGVWKTTDYGQLWTNVSDGYFQTGSIGAIEVAESDPDIVYVGTGSDGIRSNVIIGRGVYKSVDAGRTWTFLGLREIGQVGSVRVHPQNPDIVYVAAIGNPFRPNPERGVFRSKDGGRTWEKVLFVNDRTGAVSLAMNPDNPNEIYAAAWRGERKGWTIISGGPATEGGIYKTTNAGDTWTKLGNGLPGTLIGKIDLDLSRSNPKRVYALVEAPGEERGLYRTDDGGQSWQQVSSEFNLIRRPFYYTNVDADPKDENTVYVNNEGFFKSTDGGRTFRSLPVPHGDNHGMWINPDNPEIFIQSNDGGANVTLNGGRTWSTQYNQPTAEIYQVEVDSQFPYRLYGAQQDNSTLIVPSLPPVDGRPDDPIQLWMQGPGCETGPIKPRIDNPMIVFGVCKGEFYRTNLATGQTQSYWVYPQNRYGHAARDIKYRFQRVSPFEMSPHNPNVIYHGSQYLHRTVNGGQTWETISPDLTANEPDKQGISGEPITRDITGEEIYSTIYAIEESPLERGVIWVGANDGPVHVTRDGGKTWKNVTPPDLQPGGRVQNIEASPHRKGSAYVAIYRYLLGDFQPYIYRTDDYGATWTRLTSGRNGVPADTPTRVVREDPDRQGLLYAGTEFGMFVSFDNGLHWQSLQLNLPVTPVTDIRIHQKDLVMSTMGRSFWILDNLTPLHQLAVGTTTTSTGPSDNGNGDRAATLAAQASPSRATAADMATSASAAFLFRPRVAYRTRYTPMGTSPDEPQYLPPGAHLDYYLGSAPASDIRLEIRDAGDALIRVFTSEAGAAGGATGAGPEMRGPRGGQAAPTRLDKRRGMHRFIWDLRYPMSVDTAGRGTGSGPHVVPGTYQVRLSAGDWSQTRSLEVRIDPRVARDGVTQADLQEQLEFNLKVRDAIGEARGLGANVTALRQKLRQQGGQDAAVRQLGEIEAKIVTAGGAYPQPMLIDQFSNIYRMTSAADQKVGRDAFQRYDDLMKELAALKAEFARMAAR